MYPQMALQLMCVLGVDISASILPRSPEWSAENGVHSKLTVTKSIASICIDALVSALEAFAYFEQEEKTTDDLNTQSYLFKNLRVAQFVMMLVRKLLYNKLTKSKQQDSLTISNIDLCFQLLHLLPGCCKLLF